MLDRLIEIRGVQQHTEPGTELETTEPTERQPNTMHESAEGDTSPTQPQPPMSPPPEEPVTIRTTEPLEPEPTPQGIKDPQEAATTRELPMADTITQQPQPPISPQTEVPTKMVTREPLEPEPTM